MPVQPEILRQIPLFAPLSREELAHVAAFAVERHFERGDLVLLEGDRGGLHYLLSGAVKIFKTSPEGKEQVLRLIEPGQTFNDVPALDGGPNPASVAALEESVIYAIGRAELQQLILERPAVATAAVKALATALRFMLGRVEDLSFRHVSARVAKILLEQDVAVQAGRTTHRLTQQEMAAIAGTAREMVGRALKELEAQGAIELRQGHVSIRDRERLLQALG